MNVTVGVTAGLFGAWLIHDLEEWFTMAPWLRKNADKIAQNLPVRPPWGDGGISDDHAHAAIAAMGAVILAASAMGVKSRGRSRFFQTGSSRGQPVRQRCRNDPASCAPGGTVG